MIFDMESERAQVFGTIFESVKCLSSTCTKQQLEKHKSILTPFSETPYFILVGKSPEGQRVMLTPTEIFQVIHVSLQREEYQVLAARALIMCRLVTFFSQVMDPGEFKVFLDPFATLLRMAGIAFVGNKIDFKGRPLGFDICYPFGKCLMLKFNEKEDRYDLDLRMQRPGLFLTYPPPSEELNKKEKNLFGKLRAYAAGNESTPFNVTMNSYIIKDP